MVDGFSVSGTIPHMVEEMRAQTTAIVEALNDLQNRIRPMAETWTGEAKTAWEEVDRQWTAAVGDMEGRFGKAGVTLHHSFENYLATDKKISYNFGGGRGR
ncbi:WXG100 family type VII secretion target [Actinosynnema sp. NPDC020468]|uniref:WXG100 family type VII secretion target n=1 Tax=Actinosynnema sp. NPDC020468 TaxID=3154488 RepID=UPI0033F960C0